MKHLFLFLLFISSLSYGQATLPLSSNQTDRSNKPLKIGDEEIVNIATQHPYNSVGTRGIVFEKEFYSKKASYIKLYFKHFDLAPGDYVEITATNIGESVIYGGKGKIIDAELNTISDFWTRVLFDERVVVRLHAKEPSNYYGFDIEKVAYGYPQEKIDAIFAEEKAICGSDEKEPVICHYGSIMYNKGFSVARLLIGGTGSCTGWLLGCEGHLMTNRHCIGSAADANNTDFTFGYQHTDCNGTIPSRNAVTVASSSTLIKSSTSLDYALVKLPVNPTATYGHLSLSSVAPVVNDRIYIVGHPGGRRREITVTTNRGGDANGNALINHINNSRVSYYADTEPGSSGSPVIDYNSNLVVAIHNTGGCMNGAAGRCDQLITDIGTDMPNCGVDDLSCRYAIRRFPYVENFEGSIRSWKQGTGDDMDWTVHSGSTPSSNTGPSAASRGSGYVYMEASGNTNKQAFLNSPCFKLNGISSPTVSFNYHMYGASTMGSLELQASTDGFSWTTIWSRSGNRGNRWRSSTVSLNNYTNEPKLHLRFKGTTGANWQGDIALDYFQVRGTTIPCHPVQLTLNFDNAPEETSWSLENSAGLTVAYGGTYANSADGSHLYIGNCLIADCYTLTMNDTQGNGMCCTSGNGSYSLTNARTGAVLASGASFGNSETTSFCIGSTQNASNQSANNQSASSDNLLGDITEGTFLNVFPNPFTDNLQIQTNIEGLNNYTLVNLQGQIIKTGSIQNNTVLLDDLSRGVYFITFVNDTEQIVRKIIKQ